MLNRKPKILFLSTGDATRSQMAAAFLRRKAVQSFEVASAAVRSDASHPLTNDVMREAGIDMAGEISQSIAESLKEPFACVITICDATRERHPIFPFTPRLVHWSVTDPAGFGLEVLRHVRDEIEEQVARFIADFGPAATGPASSPTDLANAPSWTMPTYSERKEHRNL